MIQLFKPFMDEDEVEAVAKVIRSGWLGLGPRTAEFEENLAEYLGMPHVVALNSCTAALDIALRLLNIGSGDEVIVPTMTFVSTAHAVLYNQATPIFVDVDRTTLQIDPADVAKRISHRTRAIIVVHYSGRPYDLDRIRESAPGIPIIEDAAHACGSTLRGQKCGSLSDISCFSFHAVKNLAVGDGGALALRDQAMFERAKRLRWLGIDKGTWDRVEGDVSYLWEYSVDEIGYKSHMNDIAAAIGLAQLKKLDGMNARRAEIAEQYSRGFSELSWLETPPPDSADSASSWHIYCVQVENRDELIAHLQEHGIATGVHYKPIHGYACYGEQPRLPIAESIFERILSLPMHPGLSDEDVEAVVDAVRDFQ